MRSFQSVADLAKAEALWRNFVPAETVFDLWETRLAFHRHFDRPVRFLSGRTDGRRHFLALSWVEEKRAWCFFPGETWAGKTWLEQNRFCWESAGRERLAEEVRGDFHLRYIVRSQAGEPSATVDETGYLFHPPAHRYDLRSWWALASRRHARSLRHELDALENRGVAIRPGGTEDYDRLVTMSLARFGDASYFAEPRFREGFRDWLSVLERLGLLRATVVVIGGETAAVDFGSVYRGRYTLLAGGTDARFPAVAKRINLHHLAWACEARLGEVDFLCGDFSWKPLFHLTPRPLFLYSSLENQK